MCKRKPSSPGDMGDTIYGMNVSFVDHLDIGLSVGAVLLLLVRFPNCIVYSWVYNTQKTVKFDFDCFHSLH